MQTPRRPFRFSYRRAFFLLPLLILITCFSVSGQPERIPTLAVLDFGNSPIGRLTSETLSSNLKRSEAIAILDRDQVRVAAKGAGYAGSLNMSVREARDLGAALGCDFYIVGDAQTLRRSPSTGPVYFESYASIFLVSSRTGRLVLWERPNHQAPKAASAEQPLLRELANDELRGRLISSLRRAQHEERVERELTFDRNTPIIEEAPDGEGQAEAQGLRLPRPYRRLIPFYPDTAARAEAEAVVDVLVDLDAAGEVKRVEVARWAGFGLDQSTVETVRRLHFFPAMREGVAIPIRVLLRYNFRKPPPE